MRNETLQVGEIVNTHGLRGEVKVVAWTDSPEVFEELEYVYADVRKQKMTLEISHIKYQKANLIVKFKGIDTIDDAEKLKGNVVYVDRDRLGEPDGYYICDLLGCAVKTDDGELLGELVDVFKTGSNDVYTVKRADGKQVLLPVIDEVILSVDIENNEILVHLLEGLVD